MDKKQIADAFDKDSAQGLLIIMLAFVMGIVTMCGIGIFMHFTEAEPSTETSVAHLLTMITLIYFVFSMFLGKFVLRKLTKPGQGDNAELIIMNIRTGVLAQLAVLESGALLGCVAFIFAALEGYSQVAPIAWANFIPAAYMVLHVVRSIPPKNRIVQVFEEVWQG